MSQSQSVDLSEVFTPDEIARAAGVEPRSVYALLASETGRPRAATRYIGAAEAIRLGRQLRALAARGVKPRAMFELFGESRARVVVRPGSSFASTLVHGVLIGAVLWLTAGPTETAPVEEVSREDTRLVFLMMPGPGGGGGGGGLRSPLPAPRLTRRGLERARASVPPVATQPVPAPARPEPKPPQPAPTPAPEERAPEPLPARVLVAPVVTAAAEDRDRQGVVDRARGEDPSQGPGAAGGAGDGHGAGSGAGLGAGLGAGSGGGAGGGPYRPGSGVEPPRLRREVKAEYTDEARRRGVTGEVILEIVVRRDGSVGEIRMVKGLDAGLDQRAVAAVRQWRFDPARRGGAAVDVIVEVAVEFTLR